MDPKILFVDDEKLILDSFRRMLFDYPIQPFFATSAEKAISILDKHDFHIVISDLKMPYIDGNFFLNIVEQYFPNVVRIAMTGCIDNYNINNSNVYKLLLKPISLEDDLIPTIKDALKFHRSNL